MLKLLGIQLNPAVGAVIGIVALGLGLASDRPPITVIGAVLLVVSGVRAWTAWQGRAASASVPAKIDECHRRDAAEQALRRTRRD